MTKGRTIARGLMLAALLASVPGTVLAQAAPVAPATGDPASAASWAPIDPGRLSAAVRVLASDELQGRAPGTEGETRTIEWLTRLTLARSPDNACNSLLQALSSRPPPRGAGPARPRSRRGG